MKSDKGFKKPQIEIKTWWKNCVQCHRSFIWDEHRQDEKQACPLCGQLNAAN